MFPLTAVIEAFSKSTAWWEVLVVLPVMVPVMVMVPLPVVETDGDGVAPELPRRRALYDWPVRALSIEPDMLTFPPPAEIEPSAGM
jgi:hypothetical protein